MSVHLPVEMSLSNEQIKIFSVRINFPFPILTGFGKHSLNSL